MAAVMVELHGWRAVWGFDSISSDNLSIKYMIIKTLWSVTPCGSVVKYILPRWSCCSQLQGENSVPYPGTESKSTINQHDTSMYVLDMAIVSFLHISFLPFWQVFWAGIVSVGIVTRLGAGRSVVWILAEARDIALLRKRSNLLWNPFDLLRNG